MGGIMDGMHTGQHCSAPGIRKGTPVSVETTPRQAPGARPQRQAGKATGAWADGDLTPLNDNEEFKKADDGLNVRPRIEDDLLQATGFASIARDDLRGRMRWWGLYTQRKPGIDGGKTAILDPERARRRVLHAARPQRRRRAHHRAAAHHRRDQHGVRPRHRRHHRPAEHPAATGSASRTSPRSGSASRRSGSPPPRPAATPRASSSARRSPASPPTRSSTARPAVREILDRYIGSPEFSNLPRKFKTAISGSPQPRRRPRGQRHLVRRGRPPRARPRLRRVGRRRPVHQPDVRAAPRRLGHPRRGPRGLEGRRLDLPRLRLPPAAQPRPAEVPRRRLGRREVPRGAREGVPRAGRSSTAPRPQPPSEHRRDHVGVHPQQDGRFWVGVAPVAAASAAPRCMPSRSWPTRHGSGRVRLTAHQKLLVLDVPRSRSPALESPGSRAWVCPAAPSEWRRGVMACTGIEFCKLALVETKARARTVVRRAGAAPARVRRAVLHPRQRLPQLVRPHPGRRRRPQGHGADRRRRQPRGGLPGPPRRRPRHRAAARPARPRALQGPRRGPARLRRAPGAAIPRPARTATSRFAAWARRAEEDDLR